MQLQKLQESHNNDMERVALMSTGIPYGDSSLVQDLEERNEMLTRELESTEDRSKKLEMIVTALTKTLGEEAISDILQEANFSAE